MLFVKYATIITTGSELAKEKFNNLLNMSDKGGVSYWPTITNSKL